MKLGIKKEVEVEVKTIKINVKCSDCCNLSLHDQDGMIVKDHDGYVPDIFSIGGGDYIEMEINIETGQILNWEVPDIQSLKDFINGEDE